MNHFKISFVRSLLPAVFFWAALITFFKGSGEINEWALANWNIVYDWGVYKRGFVGTIFRPLLESGVAGLSSYEIIWFLGVAFFIILVLIVCCIFWRVWIRFGKNETVILMGLVFIVSPFFTMMSNILAYLDYFLYFFLVLSVIFIIRGKFWWACVINCLAVFVHEAALVIVYPVSVFLMFFIHSKKGNNPLFLWEYDASCKVFMIFPIVMAFILLVAQGEYEYEENLRSYMHSEIVSDLKERDHNDYIHEKDFIKEERFNSIADTVTDLVFTSISEYVSDEFLKGFDRILDLEYWVVIFSFLFVWLSWGGCFINGTCHKISLNVFFILSIFAPLLLHFVAFDTERIWIMPMFCAVVGGWALIEVEDDVFVSGVWQVLIDILLLLFLMFYVVLRPFSMTDDYVDIRYYEYLVFYSPVLALGVWLVVSKYKPVLEDFDADKKLNRSCSVKK